VHISGHFHFFTLRNLRMDSSVFQLKFGSGSITYIYYIGWAYTRRDYTDSLGKPMRPWNNKTSFPVRQSGCFYSWHFVWRVVSLTKQIWILNNIYQTFYAILSTLFFFLFNVPDHPKSSQVRKKKWAQLPLVTLTKWSHCTWDITLMTLPSWLKEVNGAQIY